MLLNWNFKLFWLLIAADELQSSLRVYLSRRNKFYGKKGRKLMGEKKKLNRKTQGLKYLRKEQ